jgi:glycerol-3-phosphate dehydrogenase (NAD(P)+)
MGGGALVVGGGAWGTALAIHLAGFDLPVRLWVREPEIVEAIRDRRENVAFLPGVRLPDGVVPVDRFDDVAPDLEWVVAVVPSMFAREVYERLAPELPPGLPVVLATKGIEERTLALPLQVARESLGESRPCAVLSGPSFAAEVARGVPTAVVVASRDDELASRVQRRLSGGALRVYTNRDETGVQIAGALKNVIALAAGVADGLGLGLNTRAALITRGLAEITRLGLATGGRPSTFSGLAGMGDLVLTCTGALSRNRSVGQALGRGERLEDVLAASPAVAEGVRTTLSARQLARDVGVEMPIVEEMYRILYDGASPREALSRLMGRPLTAEDDHHAESRE